MTEETPQVDTADSYTYKVGLTWKEWFAPIAITVVIVINGYLALGVCVLRYTETLIALIVMAAIFGALHYGLKAKITITNDTISIIRKWKPKSWKWEDVQKAQLKANGILLIHKDYEKTDWWALKKPEQMITIPFDEIRKVINFFPDTVEVDEKVKQHLARKSFPFKWLAIYSVALLIQVSFWWLVIYIFQDPKINWDTVIGIVLAVVVIQLAVVPIALHLKRYGKDLQNPAISTCEACAQFGLGSNLIYILLGNTSPEYLLFFFLLLYLGLCLAIWRLLSVLSLRMSSLVPWTAFIFMAFIIQYPGEELRWESKRMQVYPLGPESLFEKDDKLITSFEDEWAKKWDKRQFFQFFVVWPDGRKAICFAFGMHESRQPQPGEIYYYSPEMKLVCKSKVPEVGLIAEKNGNILCWRGGSDEKMGLYCQEFGSDDCRMIPGRYMPVTYIHNQNDAKIVYYTTYEKDKPSKLMRYNWTEKENTEILQDKRLEYVSFADNDRCGYVTHDEKHYSVMIWEKGNGAKEILQKELPEAKPEHWCMQLSPYLTHAAYFQKETSSIEIIDLKSNESISIPVDREERNYVTWSRKHLFLNGSIFHITPDGSIQKMPFEIQEAENISFSLDDNTAIAYTGSMFFSNTIMVDLKSGQYKYLLAYRKAYFDVFDSIFRRDRWDADGFNHIPYDVFMRNMLLVHIDMKL